MNNNFQLAKLWMALAQIESLIDSEVIPLGGHLGIEDPDLMQALETLSEKINAHFEAFKLQAVRSGRASAR